MRDMRLWWEPGDDVTASGWRIECPDFPTPGQLAWVKGWACSGSRRDHLLRTRCDPAARKAALADLMAGRITPVVLGRTMDGRSDLVLFNAHRPRAPFLDLGA